ncbi:hypothetical protein SNEBB_001349 [Seison nebaliae]|nr:hypothetical protein SNEBB_001349 [Seison nebaliae]
MTVDSGAILLDQQCTLAGKVHLGDDCVLCSNKIQLFAYGQCNHVICHVCSMRMRILYNNSDCSICRQKLKKIIINKTEKQFDDLKLRNYVNDLTIENFRGTKRNEGLEQQLHCIYFEDENSKKLTMELFEINCQKCDMINFDSLFDRRMHMHRNHNLHECDICEKSVKEFPFEQPFYSREELKKHRTEGDKNSAMAGHPLCEYCAVRYVDDNELYRHLRLDHFFCHFCVHDGKERNTYYRGYSDLLEHFKKKHFVCEYGDCKNAQLTNAFVDEIAYIQHRVAHHGFQSPNLLSVNHDQNKNHRNRYPIGQPHTRLNVDIGEVENEDVEPFNIEDHHFPTLVEDTSATTPIKWANSTLGSRKNFQKTEFPSFESETTTDQTTTINKKKKDELSWIPVDPKIKKMKNRQKKNKSGVNTNLQLKQTKEKQCMENLAKLESNELNLSNNINDYFPSLSLFENQSQPLRLPGAWVTRTEPTKKKPEKAFKKDPKKLQIEDFPSLESSSPNSTNGKTSGIWSNKKMLNTTILNKIDDLETVTIGAQQTAEKEKEKHISLDNVNDFPSLSIVDKSEKIEKKQKKKHKGVKKEELLITLGVMPATGKANKKTKSNKNRTNKKKVEEEVDSVGDIFWSNDKFDKRQDLMLEKMVTYFIQNNLDVEVSIQKFQQMSVGYLHSDIDAPQYMEVGFLIFHDFFHVLLPDLITLMPNIPKASTLYANWKNGDYKKSKAYADFFPLVNKCTSCSQLLHPNDLEDHMELHS